MYTRGGEQSLRNSLCQKGAATPALKHLAVGDRGLPPPSLNSFPSQTDPLLCGMGGRGRENRGFCWVLVEDNSRGLGKGDVLQSSVIPLALSSSCTRVR